MRKTPYRSVLAAGICVSAVLILHGAVLQSSARRVISQPDHIVPFSADYLGIRTNRQTRTVKIGRFYRSADNSFRRESGPSPDQITLVNVRHVPHGAFYVWSRLRGFSIYPLHPPPHGWSFIHSRLGNPEDFLEERFEGFEVMREVGRRGNVSVVVPQLNFFAIYTKFCGEDGSWCDESRYSNIKVGPQPAELFEPPYGPSPRE
jgi:hypothetical protein